jgi:hypothetical protein
MGSIILLRKISYKHVSLRKSRRIGEANVKTSLEIEYQLYEHFEYRNSSERSQVSTSRRHTQSPLKKTSQLW